MGGTGLGGAGRKGEGGRKSLNLVSAADMKRHGLTLATKRRIESSSQYEQRQVEFMDANGGLTGAGHAGMLVQP